MQRISVIIPCYKRPEYTNLCLQSVLEAEKYENTDFYIYDDGSSDETFEIICKYADKLESDERDVNVYATKYSENKGLRNIIIDFFDKIKEDPNVWLMAKIDNDCMVPNNWLKNLTELLNMVNADVISPNVSESNAAYKYGRVHKKEGHFIPSEIVGGLWCMRRSMINDIYFEKFGSRGIRAAFNIIHQIVAEKSPKIGWADNVTFEDIGYWGGTHKSHIKTKDHAAYSAEVGRPIAWQPK